MQVDWLTKTMRKMDFVVSSIHGDMELNTQAVIMREFRSGSSRVLIATDQIARDIDVQQVRSHSYLEKCRIHMCVNVVISVTVAFLVSCTEQHPGALSNREA
jgi:hypothetical protein